MSATVGDWPFLLASRMRVLQLEAGHANAPPPGLVSISRVELSYCDPWTRTVCRAWRLSFGPLGTQKHHRACPVRKTNDGCRCGIWATEARC